MIIYIPSFYNNGTNNLKGKQWCCGDRSPKISNLYEWIPKHTISVNLLLHNS